MYKTHRNTRTGYNDALLREQLTDKLAELVYEELLREGYHLNEYGRIDEKDILKAVGNVAKKVGKTARNVAKKVGKTARNVATGVAIAGASLLSPDAAIAQGDGMVSPSVTTVQGQQGTGTVYTGAKGQIQNLITTDAKLFSNDVDSFMETLNLNPKDPRDIQKLLTIMLNNDVPRKLLQGTVQFKGSPLKEQQSPIFTVNYRVGIDTVIALNTGMPQLTFRPLNAAAGDDVIVRASRAIAYDLQSKLTELANTAPGHRIVPKMIYKTETKVNGVKVYEKVASYVQSLNFGHAGFTTLDGIGINAERVGGTPAEQIAANLRKILEEPTKTIVDYNGKPRTLDVQKGDTPLIMYLSSRLPYNINDQIQYIMTNDIFPEAILPARPTSQVRENRRYRRF